MTKPTTPMTTRISSQDISLAPRSRGLDDWLRRYGPGRYQCAGLRDQFRVDHPPAGTGAGGIAPGTADQPALRRAGRGRAAMVDDVTTTQPTERTGAHHVSPNRSHDHQRRRADRSPRGRPRAAPQDRQVPDLAAAHTDRGHPPAL